MLSYTYAYLIGDLLLGFFWLFLYLFRKDLRHELLITSFVFGVCGPLSEIIYLRDYWKPELLFGNSIGVEDFLFGFFIGGIACVLYKEIFHKFFLKRKDKHNWLWFVPASVVISIVILGGLITLGVNSIYASIFLFGIISLFIIFYRTDLTAEALGGGVSMLILIILFYSLFIQIFPDVFNRWWMLKNLTGVFIFDIPVEELWWAFAFGTMAGPFYDLVRGNRLKD